MSFRLCRDYFPEFIITRHLDNPSSRWWGMRHWISAGDPFVAFRSLKGRPPMEITFRRAKGEYWRGVCTAFGKRRKAGMELKPRFQNLM
jgi:hypothetical protein